MARTHLDRTGWRVVDIVVAAVLAVACGFVFAAWNFGSTGPIALVKPLLPGFQGIFNGPWLIAGPLVGLVIRRPGAALFAELLAAAVELLLFPQYGVLVLASGCAQGVGAEIVFAEAMWIFGAPRAFGVGSAVVAGLVAGLVEIPIDLTAYLPGSTRLFSTVYGVTTVVSGAIIGLVAWALVRAIAATGVLDRFAAGRSARRLV